MKSKTRSKSDKNIAYFLTSWWAPSPPGLFALHFCVHKAHTTNTYSTAGSPLYYPYLSYFVLPSQMKMKHLWWLESSHSFCLLASLRTFVDVNSCTPSINHHFCINSLLISPQGFKGTLFQMYTMQTLVGTHPFKFLNPLFQSITWYRTPRRVCIPAVSAVSCPVCSGIST